MKTIQLTRGKVAIVDDADFERLSQYKWRYASVGYAACYIEGSVSEYMHRLITSPPHKMEVDHINQDKLDNRRENLRVVTSGHNKLNRSMASNTSGATGVYYYKNEGRQKRWWAYLRLDGRRKSLGYFHTLEEASEARKTAEKDIWLKLKTTN